ncbi:hypothetical protein DFA_11758 [Cavenderia fasciculata]|uniref:IPT/TIG domain-containing protein n=1 Tax=Cavenderia fasciculata TaxID=261658 RepID=F4QE50_CACFS|nr:uncharacterized protein DFA_11758 [Cavenderia fasciculata]EGG13997.1 hypothetical protein DFA_11758 [Cavenderia fasciculata]|eukprot:XP_004350705.1 hypothetical protein DFA_11758 [Cavenderia fasciculata]
MSGDPSMKDIPPGLTDLSELIVARFTFCNATIINLRSSKSLTVIGLQNVIPASSTTNNNEFIFNNVDFGLLAINVSNSYYSAPLVITSYTIEYPIISGSSMSEPSISVGSMILINGNFGTYLTSSKVFLTNQNSRYNQTTCVVALLTSDLIKCILVSHLSSGLATVNVNIDGYTNTNTYLLKSFQTDCEISTNNCYGNGVCSQNGTCICVTIQSGAYYNNCSKTYPFITSGTINDIQQRSISLYGDFGPLFEQTNTTVILNGTMNCSITAASQLFINCTLESSPTVFGYVSAEVKVSSYQYTKPRVFAFINPSSGGGGG